jgi:hypothetical protein
MASVHDLIASKQYDKALRQIKVELRRKPKDQRLRMQQADVLIHAGTPREAVVVLLQLADDHAADGFTAKAIAILKRVEKLEPNRADVKGRIANLVQEKVRNAPAAAPSREPAMMFGMEEIDSSDEFSLGMEAVPAAAEPVLDLGSALAPSGPDFGASDGPEPQIPLGEAVTPEPLPMPVEEAEDLEGLSYVEIEPEPEPELSEPEPETSFLSTPLFEGLSEDELMAFIQGLSFSSFAAGDIVVAEGAPGDCLFILTTGRVKAWVRGPEGHYMLVKELGEGAFFGEISVLTGKPRTATITAAEDCEVLELDRPTLDSITEKYPRVGEVLKKFHEQRAMDTVETLFRKG